MGGVIRAGKAFRMMYGGVDINSIIHGSDIKWAKPNRSTFPNSQLDTDDNLLVTGSSTTGSIWHSFWHQFTPGFTSNAWDRVFRSDYNGSYQQSLHGSPPKYGVGTASTFGRISFAQAVEIARAGQYAAEVNPFLSMDDFDAYLMDSSGWNGGGYPQDTPMERWRQGGEVYPYGFYDKDSRDHFNGEFLARMEMIRLARAAGITHIYQIATWPTLIDGNDPASDAVYLRDKIPTSIESMEWQHDRMNYQIERENLGGHVSLIPFNKLIKRITDDIATGDVPGVTHLRQLFAADDESNGFDLTTAPVSAPRHHYMWNAQGSYAANCLLDRVLYRGHDPRGKANIHPMVAGYNTKAWVVPPDLAEYFQDIAVEIADSDPRTGLSGLSAVRRMPKINEGTPADILGDDLAYIYDRAEDGILPEDTVVNIANPSTRAAKVLMGVFYPNMADITPNVYNYVLYLHGSYPYGPLDLYVNNHDGNIAYLGVDSMSVGGGDMFTRMDGTNPFFFEYYAHETHNAYGARKTLFITDLTQDIMIWNVNRYWSTRYSDAANIAALSGIRATDPSIFHDILISYAEITDHQRFELLRYYSKKLQVGIYEPLTPDLVV